MYGRISDKKGSREPVNSCTKTRRIYDTTSGATLTADNKNNNQSQLLHSHGRKTKSVCDIKGLPASTELYSVLTGAYAADKNVILGCCAFLLSQFFFVTMCSAKTERIKRF